MTNLMTAEDKLRLKLGTLELTADSYRMELHRPTRRQTLVDGRFRETVLDVEPCVLRIESRVISADAAALKAAIRTAIHENTVFSFSFDRMCFTEMTIRDILFCRSENQQYMTLTLTLGGTFSGEEEDV